MRDVVFYGRGETQNSRGHYSLCLSGRRVLRREGKVLGSVDGKTLCLLFNDAFSIQIAELGSGLYYD
jgi:hypothetical protein